MEKPGAALGVNDRALRKGLANLRQFIEAKGIDDGGRRGDARA